MKTKKSQERLVVIGVKIPITLKRALDKYIQFSTYATISDFVRDAIREYLDKKAPNLVPSVIVEMLAEEEFGE